MVGTRDLGQGGKRCEITSASVQAHLQRIVPRSGSPAIGNRPWRNASALSNSSAIRWVLNPKVRIIQGDGVNYRTIRDVLTAATRAGWSADNIAFGMGGALLQQLNRDSQEFAFKCSDVTIQGEDHAVYKEPLTDQSKEQKRGRLALVERDHHFLTVADRSSGAAAVNLLQTAN